MSDPAKIELVRKALTSGLSNCVEWIDDKTVRTVRNNPANKKLTPKEIADLLMDHVKNGGPIEQRPEERDPWKSKRDFWYFVIVPVGGFTHGLFVEMELTDEDPDVPVVRLLNAHPQSR